MSKGTLEERTTYEKINTGYQATDFTREGTTGNTVGSLQILPDDLTRDLMIASESSLSSIWSTPQEDEAWKDL